MTTYRVVEGGEEAVWSKEASAVPEKEGEEEKLEAAFRLNVENGGTVLATFPFLGNPDEGQLSFQIGDSIVILEKDTQWSWGKLVRTGEEGWTPNNYVQSIFKPLPGIHELQMKMKIKQARAEAIEKGENPDEAEARVRQEMGEGTQGGDSGAVVQQEGDLSLQQGGADVGQGQYFGGAQDPNQLAWPGGMGVGGYNQMEGHNLYNQGGVGYGVGAYDPNAAALGGGYGIGQGGGLLGEGGYGDAQNGGSDWANEGEVDVAFGMWMEHLGENNSDGGRVNEDSQHLQSDVDLSERNLRREELARHLLETEERYVKLLEALIETVVKPSMGDGGSRQIVPYLSQEEAQGTFGALQTDEILSVNQALKKQLSSRVKDYNDDTCFGDLFVRFAPFLKAYIEYCTQHDSSASRVGLMASKNERFAQLLSKSSMDPRTMGMDVQSLLNLPLERIPQYKDLLERLRDSTDESHPDYELLGKAIEHIADVANFIDESIKERENQGKLLGVQAILTDPNCLDLEGRGKKRIYVKSGVLTKFGNIADRKDYFALFNDSLLHAKKANFGNKFVFRRMTELLRVEDVTSMKSRPKARISNVFRVVTNGHIYLLEAPTLEEKRAWMRVLQMVISSVNRKQLYQGPLQIIKLDRDPPEMKQGFFYVFNDVVVTGKTLWKGKFKYKQTIYVQRVEEEFMYNPHMDPPLPAELSSDIALSGGLPSCFRLIDVTGQSMLLMASSLSEKSNWLKALNRMLDYRNKDTVIVNANYESNNLEDDALASDDSSGTPKKKTGKPSTNAAKSRRRGKKGNSLSGQSKSKRKESSSPASQEIKVDLLDLLSGEPTPSQSSAKSSNTAVSRNSEGGGRKGKQTQPPQNTYTTAGGGLLPDELAVAFAAPSAGLQQHPPGGGAGYAPHHQGGMPNYAQHPQQQHMQHTTPDGKLYVEPQQQSVNAFPPQGPQHQHPPQAYMGNAVYQGGGVGMQQPHYYQQNVQLQQPGVVQTMDGGVSQPIPMAHHMAQQQTPAQQDGGVNNVYSGSQYQQRG